jgi:ABC-2 type transport system ATP-binding protein
VEIRDLIREIGRERTVVLSTHIMQEVEATCSKAIIISGGKLVGHGTLKDLLKQSRLCSGYTVSIKTARENAERSLNLLKNFSVVEWLSPSDASLQRILINASDELDRAEEIFNWAVENKLTLTELSPQEASLEEVFRELTQ